MKNQNRERGESLVELILALAIFAAVLPVLLFAIGSVNQSQPHHSTYFQASLLALETKDIVMQLKNSSWQNVAANGTYTLIASSGEWVLTPLAEGQDAPANNDGLTRRVMVADIYRDNGRVSDAGIVDPASKRITTFVSWNNLPTPVESEFIVTRSEKSETLSLTTEEDFNVGAFAGITLEGVGEAASLTVANNPPPKPSGLVSWWRMTGEFAANDAELDSVGESQNNAQIFGDPTFTAARYGNQIALNSPIQYIQVASSNLTDVGLFGDTSVEFVFLPGRGDGPLVGWYERAPTQKNGVLARFLSDTSELHVNFVDRDGVDHVVKTGEDSLSSSEASHVVMTYTKGEGRRRIYINGDKKTDDTPGIFTPQTAYDILMGRDAQGVSFAGAIDEVAIYDRALTDEEVWLLAQPSHVTGHIESATPRFFHTLRARVIQPTGTKIRFQVALADVPIGDSCESATYYFVGPDGTAKSYYDAGSTTYPDTITGPIPITGESLYFKNPARCAKVKTLLFSSMVPTISRPVVQSVDIMYLP